VEIDGHIHRLLDESYARNVIDVRMREQDVHDMEAVIANCTDQFIGLISRVDHNGFTRALAADDKSVLIERWNGANFENHSTTIVSTPNPQPWVLGVGSRELTRMVLCLVDDLIFSIKISTAARALAAPVFFERMPEMILPRIRETRPSLVILDLNSAKLRPLEVIAQMKADPGLRDIRTLGYVSHVQTDVISAARNAGIDEVLARSAFSERLGQILTGPSSTRSRPPEPAE